MQFKIGPWTYHVRIARDAIRNRAGKLLNDIVDPQRREILLAGDIESIEQRIETFNHAYAHAWRAHFPAPRGEEEFCDLLASIQEARDQDLARQGGMEALLRLWEPGEEKAGDAEGERAGGREGQMGRERHYVPVESDYQPLDEALTESRDGRAQCGICLTIVADGSIVSSEPRYEARYHGQVVERTLYCPFCGHLQTWVEGSNLAGEPNGHPCCAPQYIRGAAVSVFLAKHPRAMGVVAA